MRVKRMQQLFCLLGLLVLLLSSTASAALVQQLEFDGDLTDSVATYDAGGGIGISYLTGINGWQGNAAAAFDGTANGRAWVQATAALNPTSFTQMFWVNTDADHGAYTSYMTAVDSWSWLTAFSPPNGDTLFIQQGATWTSLGYALPRDEWVHLAYAYTDADQRLRVYANGEEVFNAILPHSAAFTGATWHHIASGGGSGVYKGRMDDYRLYNTALTQQEIQAIITPDGLLQHFTFDGTFEDALYTQDLAHNASAAIVTDSMIGTGALRFIDNLGEAYTTLTWGAMGASQFTQTYWMRVPASASNPGAARLTAMTGFKWETSYIGGQLALYNVDNGAAAWQYSGIAPSLDAWHHVAWTYNGTTATLILDGEEAWAQAQANPVDISTAAVTYLGVAVNGADHFAGFIDDYRFYNRALTVSEVANMYAASPPAKVASGTPANGATDVALEPTLSWSTAALADEYHVYLGTSTPLSSGDLLTTLATTTLDVGPLSASTPHYWRVDAANGAGVTTGTGWIFTTIDDTPPADPDLRLHLTFDDGSLLDTSSYGNHATAFGDAVTTTALAANGTTGSLWVDGAGDYAKIASSTSMNVSSFTLMMWAATTGTVDQGALLRLSSYDDYAFDVAVSYGSAIIYDGAAWSSAAGYWWGIPEGDNAFVWNHVAISVEAPAGGQQLVHVYVNGNDTGIIAGAWASGPDTNVTGKALYLAANYLGTENIRGYIDDVRLYSKAMTQAEIRGILGNTEATAVSRSDWMLYR